MDFSKTQLESAVVGLAMAAGVEVVDHGDEVEDREPGRLLHRVGVGRQDRAFEQDGADLGMALGQPPRHRDGLLLQAVRVEHPALVEHRALELRPLLEAGDVEHGLGLDARAPQEVVAEAPGIRRHHADGLLRPEAGGDHRELQQAREQDRDSDRRRHRLLVVEQEAAVAGDAPHAVALELEGALDHRRLKLGIAAQGGVDGEPRHGAEEHRIGIGGGVGDVAGNEGLGAIQQQHADGVAVGLRAFPDVVLRHSESPGGSAAYRPQSV